MTTNQIPSPSPDAVLTKAAEQAVRINDKICEFRDPNQECPASYIAEMCRAILPALELKDVPPVFRLLQNVLVSFAVRWYSFLSGFDYFPGGWPSIAVSTKVLEVDHALKESRKPRPGRQPLPSIKKLREEFNGHPQSDAFIAQQYGYQEQTDDGYVWRGPFYRDGHLDARKVWEEEANPGSVVPAGWHPADYRPGAQIVAMAGVEFAVLNAIRQGAALDVVTQEEDQPVKAVSQEVVRKMIAEGMVVEQIARLSGYADHEVQEIAKNAGLQVLRRAEYFKPPRDVVKEEHDFAWAKAVELAGIRNEAAIANANGNSASAMAPTDDPADDFETSPVAAVGVPNDVPTFPAASAVDDRVKDALREMLNGNSELTTVLAISELRAKGLTANAMQIGRVLAELRKELAVPATVG